MVRFIYLKEYLDLNLSLLESNVFAPIKIEWCHRNSLLKPLSLLFLIQEFFTYENNKTYFFLFFISISGRFKRTQPDFEVIVGQWREAFIWCIPLCRRCFRTVTSSLVFETQLLWLQMEIIGVFFARLSFPLLANLSPVRYQPNKFCQPIFLGTTTSKVLNQRSLRIQIVINCDVRCSFCLPLRWN